MCPENWNVRNSVFTWNLAVLEFLKRKQDKRQECERELQMSTEWRSSVNSEVSCIEWAWTNIVRNKNCLDFFFILRASSSFSGCRYVNFDFAIVFHCTLALYLRRRYNSFSCCSRFGCEPASELSSWPNCNCKAEVSATDKPKPRYYREIL